MARALPRQAPVGVEVNGYDGRLRPNPKLAIEHYLEELDRCSRRNDLQ
jgi:hypothetical protein